MTLKRGLAGLRRSRCDADHVTQITLVMRDHHPGSSPSQPREVPMPNEREFFPSRLSKSRWLERHRMGGHAARLVKERTMATRRMCSAAIIWASQQDYSASWQLSDMADAPISRAPGWLSRDTMSYLALVGDRKYSTERREDSTNRSVIGLVLSEHARMAFAFMSVALGPAFVWLLVWIASG